MKTSNWEPTERAIFFVDGPPIPKGRPRATARGGYTILYTPKATKEYEDHVAKVASKHIPKTGIIMGPISISLTFYLKAPKRYAKKMDTPHVTRPDVDNLAKAILDGLEGVLYKNDAQVTTLYVHKCYGEKPRVGVSVSELVELQGEKTQLCTECDKEYEPAEWWWMDWKSKKKEKRGEETSEEEKDMDAHVLMEKVYQHRIFISPSVVEIPFHLENHPKFKELIAKRDTQTYESTYSFICPAFCPKDELKANKELVWKFCEKHPGGWSVSNEKIEKRSKS